MSIGSIASSIFINASPPTQGVQSQQGPAGADPDGDGGTRKAHHHGHGHGQMQNALMQALQSLGLTPPTAATTSAPSSTSTTATTATTASGSTAAVSGTDSDGDADGSTSGTGNVKKDLRHFMHELFQAIKNESSANASTSTSATTGSNGTGDPKNNFASGLSTLISQVSSGQAPADLQSAFSQVVADMQPASASGSSTSNGSGSGSSSPEATLQALLTQLQQNLGYGSASSTAAIGNFVNQQA